MKITIDGKEVEVVKGQTVLQVCLENGVDIPYFCYHKKLSVAGNCRMCLVEVEKRPKLEISCNTPVVEGMVVKTNSPTVLDARKSVLEFILINHPLDCPICDQAGECDLQDQYFDFSSQGYRFRETKNKKPKAVRLGDRVVLDDERCIVCTRCVRFCDEIAKDHELCVTERSDHSTITSFKGEGMKNAYSGNTVDICPVGALTDRDFRFNKRVWFLNKSESICSGCATGCNIWIDHEQNIVYRYRPRENDDVNESWMCDEGRLSYKFINAADRIVSPHIRIPSPQGERVAAEGGRVRGDCTWSRTTWAEAWTTLQMELEKHTASQRGVVLSAQCTNEELQAWHWLAADAWKTSHLFATKREYANPTSDDILRSADKNPNSAGLHRIMQNMRRLEPSPLAHRLLFVLDTLTDAEIAQLEAHRPAFVVVLATNWGTDPDSVRWRPLSESQQVIEHGGGADMLTELRKVPSTQAFAWADLILPLATFAEQQGSFTNVQGMIQSFDPAIAPKGEAVPACRVVRQLAEMENIPLAVPLETSWRVLP